MLCLPSLFILLFKTNNNWKGIQTAYLSKERQPGQNQHKYSHHCAHGFDHHLILPEDNKEKMLLQEVKKTIGRTKHDEKVEINCFTSKGFFGSLP